jgi:hypothetical protein
MIAPRDTLENPVTGERFTFTHTAASTDGELLAFEFSLRPAYRATRSRFTQHERLPASVAFGAVSSARTYV